MALFVLTGCSAFGQKAVSSKTPVHFLDDSKWGIRVSYGVTSDIHTENYVYGHRHGIGYDYYVPYYNYPNLSAIYGKWHGLTYTSGSFGLGLDYRLFKWLSLSMDASMDVLWQDRYDSYDDTEPTKNHGYSVSLLPGVKFFAVNSPVIRLYGGLSLGLTKYIGYDRLSYLYEYPNGYKVYQDDSYDIAYQIVPFGIELGRKLFGFAELGYGSIFAGARIGMGYKF